MRRLAIILVGGALLTTGAAACGDDDDSAEIPGGVDFAEGEVPGCFPDDTPVPDGDVQAGFELDQGENPICTFTVVVDRAAVEAVADYRSALEDDDWEVVYDTTAQGSASVGVTKGDDGIIVGGSELEGTTTVSVAAGTAETVMNSAPPTSTG